MILLTISNSNISTIYLIYRITHVLLFANKYCLVLNFTIKCGMRYGKFTLILSVDSNYITGYL